MDNERSRPEESIRTALRRLGPVELDAEAEEMAEVSTELEAEAEDALDEVLEEDLSGEAAGAEGLEHSEDERSNGD
jgi:hypothetical protein